MLLGKISAEARKLGSVENPKIGLIWLVTRGGWGGGVGGVGQGGGQGGEAPQSTTNNLIGLIWLVTRGGWGEAWLGGAPESSVGATSNNWSDLAAPESSVCTGSIFQGGEMGRCGEQQGCTGSTFWAPLKT